MRKTTFFKICSIVLTCVLVFTLFSGCGNNTVTSSQDISSADTSSDTQSEVSSQTSSANAVSTTVTGGGAKPRVVTVFSTYDGADPVITFKNFAERGNFTAKIVIKDLKGKTVHEESGIKTNSYTLKKQLIQNEEYDLFVYYKSDSGKEGLFGGIGANGMRIRYQRKETSKSKYYFDGGITLDTLNNYLNRVTVNCQFFQEDDFDMVEESILGIGAKYVQRAVCVWTPGKWEHNIKGTIKKSIEKIHAKDPEVVFEACIFECINKGVENIEIPAFVFEKFGLTPETRNFDLEKMYFPDGYGKNKWGTGTYIPDITQLETQMFFYYRATFFIDLGCEALHLGQANLIGKQDTDNKCWTKVIGMIRDYAKENARRHYVIIDAHYPSQEFVGTDGKMLVDFNAFPLRIHVADGQKDHMPSEKEPQLCVIKPGTGDAVYQKGIQGISPSGWHTDKYPYLVEIDNWGINEKNLHKASSSIWGYDEITWYASQPQWYRHQFVEDLIKQIDSFNENGHMSIPTKRWISKVPNLSDSNCYYAAKGDGVNFYDDLTFIKDLWKRLGK